MKYLIPIVLMLLPGVSLAQQNCHVTNKNPDIMGFKLGMTMQYAESVCVSSRKGTWFETVKGRNYSCLSAEFDTNIHFVMDENQRIGAIKLQFYNMTDNKERFVELLQDFHVHYTDSKFVKIKNMHTFKNSDWFVMFMPPANRMEIGVYTIWMHSNSSVLIR